MAHYYTDVYNVALTGAFACMGAICELFIE